MEDFVNVKKNKRRKNKKCDEKQLFETRLNIIKSDLMSTTFYDETLGKLKAALTDIASRCNIAVSKLKDNNMPSTDLICYGLGNFTESYIARYQLALLLALRCDLQVDGELCEVYDPIFIQEEKDFLSLHSMKVPDENQEGKHRCREDTVTIFYMPHCGKALYNNVLWRNWHSDCLQRLIIIGNSFSRMIDSTPSRILDKTASYVMKIHPYVQETDLECPSDLDNIFNDTSIHTFNVQEVPVELWEEVEEPQYDSEDAEIILASNVS